jgi:hypothetical protein
VVSVLLILHETLILGNETSEVENFGDVLSLLRNDLDQSSGTFEDLQRLCLLGKDGEALSQKVPFH